MLELNKVMIVGRLTRDPEMMHTAGGTMVAKISIAVNRRGFGDREDETHFFDVSAFGQTAEFVEKYFTKGKSIYVDGRLVQDRWQYRESGANRSKVCIIAERVQFGESKAQAENLPEAQGSAPPLSRPNAPVLDGSTEPETQDHLPF